jgi:ribosome-binding factor A
VTRSHRHRPERLGALIQESIAEAIATQLKDPRVGFVTVTGVTVSPDSSHATVRISVMGSEQEKASAMEGLSNARGFLRTHLARNLRMRSAPELHLVLDRGLEHASRIETIIQQIKQEEPEP